MHRVLYCTLYETRFHQTPRRTREAAHRRSAGRQRHSPSFSAWKSDSGKWETATTLPSNLRLANDLSAAAASLVDDLVRVRVTARVRIRVRVRVRIRVRVRVRV